MSSSNIMGTPKIDDILRACIDDIWDEFDTDNDGELDQKECKKFIINAIKELQNAGQPTQREASSLITDESSFNDADFATCFRKVDTDGSGQITKDEMLQFIKVVANLENETARR